MVLLFGIVESMWNTQNGIKTTIKLYCLVKNKIFWPKCCPKKFGFVTQSNQAQFDPIQLSDNETNTGFFFSIT